MGSSDVTTQPAVQAPRTVQGLGAVQALVITDNWPGCSGAAGNTYDKSFGLYAGPIAVITLRVNVGLCYNGKVVWRNWGPGRASRPCAYRRDRWSLRAITPTSTFGFSSQ